MFKNIPAPDDVLPPHLIAFDDVSNVYIAECANYESTDAILNYGCGKQQLCGSCVGNLHVHNQNEEWEGKTGSCDAFGTLGGIGVCIPYLIDCCESALTRFTSI